MLEVQVKYSDEGLQAALASLAGDLTATTELHQAMAVAVEEKVRDHLLGLNSRSPHTGYYAKASRSVESSADAAAGTVTVPHRGVALRYHGGRVEMKDKHLALPTENVPVRGDERLRPGEIPDLAFIPRAANSAPGTFGFLVEGEKNAKGRLVPKKREDGGKLMFVLRAYTDHAPDPTVIPDDAALTASAAAAGEDYLSAMIRERGLI
jgi:hypothetical protein